MIEPELGLGIAFGFAAIHMIIAVLKAFQGPRRYR